MSLALHQVTRVMRSVQGTHLEPLRNSILTFVGSGMDLAYVARHSSPRLEALHPISKLIVAQVGDPMSRWDVTNIPMFRQQFEELLDYLPHPIFTTKSTHESDLLDYVAYAPSVNSSPPIVFLHGGGFVLGNMSSNDTECSWLASRVHATVYSVEYPLAPETKLPETLASVIRFLRNGPVGRESFFLWGESAGGNLAAAALMQADDLRNQCRGMILSYPWLDLTLESGSIERLGAGYFLTRNMLDWFRNQYLPTIQVDLRDPMISPLFGDWSSMPDIISIVGQCDPLIDDSISLIERAPTSQLWVVPGMLHGFMQQRGISAARMKALNWCSEFVNNHL